MWTLKVGGTVVWQQPDINTLSLVDNPALQDAVLHFVMTVLTVDHPKFCKPLRMNVLIIKVSYFPLSVVDTVVCTSSSRELMFLRELFRRKI